MSDNITIEQSAAQQIGESITCWLASKLAEPESWQEVDDDRKFAGSITIKVTQLDDGKLAATVKTKITKAADAGEIDLVIDDPNQMKLPIKD